jgi:hypothetical protein
MDIQKVIAVVDPLPGHGMRVAQLLDSQRFDVIVGVTRDGKTIEVFEPIGRDAVGYVALLESEGFHTLFGIRAWDARKWEVLRQAIEQDARILEGADVDRAVWDNYQPAVRWLLGVADFDSQD